MKTFKIILYITMCIAYLTILFFVIGVQTSTDVTSDNLSSNQELLDKLKAFSMFIVSLIFFSAIQCVHKMK